MRRSLSRQMALATDEMAMPKLEQWVRDQLIPRLQTAAPAQYNFIKYGYVRTCAEAHQHPHRTRWSVHHYLNPISVRGRGGWRG